MNITCKNCDHNFQGNFCPNCGQKAETHTIDSRFIFHEAPHAIFHIDKGILYTFKELSLRPGKTVLDYIRGKRVKHFSPIAYTIILSSLFLLISNLFEHYAEASATVGNTEVHERVSHMMGFIFLSFAPAFALFHWLLFRKYSQLNYWQFLVASTFFIGHSIFILLLIRLITFDWGSSSIAMAVLTPLFLYLVISFYQMLNGFYRNRTLLVAKLILALLVSLVCCMFVFIAFLAIIEKLILIK